MQENSREALVAGLRQRLSVETYPRLTVLAALIVSGGGAALFSALGLHAHLSSMPVRYFCAVVVGYALFLSCIRAWIAFERRRIVEPGGRTRFRGSGPGNGASIADFVPDLDMMPGRGAASRGAANLFAGGQSGGAGGGAEWAAIASDSAGTSESGSRLGDAAGGVVSHVSDALDSDELMWLAAALAAALGGLLAVFWIIYIAPVLLAEVALDAALVGTAYGRLRQQDLESWTTAVVRRTWIPATALAAMMTLAGWALQHVAPGAHSIGAVVRKVLG